jgi:hypothetical protein
MKPHDATLHSNLCPSDLLHISMAALPDHVKLPFVFPCPSCDLAPEPNTNVGSRLLTQSIWFEMFDIIYGKCRGRCRPTKSLLPHSRIFT